MAFFPTRTAVESAKIVNLIEVRSRYGSGGSDADPVREVVEYFTMEGEKVAEFDPFNTTAFQRSRE